MGEAMTGGGLGTSSVAYRVPVGNRRFIANTGFRSSCARTRGRHKGRGAVQAPQPRLLGTGWKLATHKPRQFLAPRREKQGGPFGTNPSVFLRTGMG